MNRKIVILNHLDDFTKSLAEAVASIISNREGDGASVERLPFGSRDALKGASSIVVYGDNADHLNAELREVMATVRDSQSPPRITAVCADDTLPDTRIDGVRYVGHNELIDALSRIGKPGASVSGPATTSVGSRETAKTR